MSIWSRLKSWAGGSSNPPVAISIAAGATAFNIPDHSNNFMVTAAGVVTIATINATGPIFPGRTIMLSGAVGTAAVTLTNNAATTTKGQIDAGAADLTLDDDDIIILTQRRTGAWAEVVTTDN